MAALPPRPFNEIRKSQYGTPVGTYVTLLDSDESLIFEELSRVELLRLTSILEVPYTPDNKPFKWNVTDLLAACNRAAELLPEGAVIDAQAPVKASAPIKPQAAPQANATQAEALQALLASLTPQAPEAAPIDTATITQLATEVAVEVFEGLAETLRPREINVTVGAAPTLTLPGPSHFLLERVLKYVSNGINVMLVGPAGSGKTTLASQVAQALELPFGMCGAEVQEHHLLGFIDAHGTCTRTPFREIFENGGLWLFDEMDGASAEALLVANAALANGHAPFPDGLIKRHQKCHILAAANTFGTGATAEYVGRNQLDAATLDRYWRISFPYDETLESSLVSAILPTGEATQWLTNVRTWRARAEGQRVIVSPRLAIEGARMIAVGISHDEAASRLFESLPADMVRKIRNGGA
jgi:MoxR-like ATPase